MLIVSMMVTPQLLADAQRVDQFLAGLATMQASFSQTVESESGSVYHAGGVLYLSRPGKFRWDYAGEEGQLIVADGNRVWLLDRELEQVSHQSQKSALRGTPAQLLSDDAGVESHFSIEGNSRENDIDWTILAPKDKESQVQHVRIGFSGEQLAALEMDDKFGQITRFRFTNVRRNPSLDQSLFRFDAPKGFDVWEH